MPPTRCSTASFWRNWSGSPSTGRSRFPGWWAATIVSRFAGPGQEFLDHRNFHHGDDLRAVNWRAYLRLEKLFLKMFQVEPRVPVRVADRQQRLHGGASTRQFKFDYARKLAGALCYVGLVRLDTITLRDPCFALALLDPFHLRRRPPSLSTGVVEFSAAA